MGEFIILFREGLEASLIVGIVYTLLARTGLDRLTKQVWYAVLVALVASVVVGLGLHAIADILNKNGLETLFEAVMMFVAAGFLIYMIAWIGRRHNIAAELRQATSQAAAVGGGAVFGVVFFAVLREGFETAIFLFASDNMGQGSWLGALSGLAFAVALGVVIFKVGKKLPIQRFFAISSYTLMFMAAGMVAYGCHETEEYLAETGLLETAFGTTEGSLLRPYIILTPTTQSPDNPAFYSFDPENNRYTHILHDKGSVGTFLKALFGYNSDPNWPEFLLWGATLLGTYWLYRRANQPKREPANPEMGLEKKPAYTSTQV